MSLSYFLNLKSGKTVCYVEFESGTVELLHNVQLRDTRKWLLEGGLNKIQCMNCLPKKSGRNREVTDSGEVAGGGEVADSGEVAISGVLAVSGEVPG